MCVSIPLSSWGVEHEGKETSDVDRRGGTGDPPIKHLLLLLRADALVLEQQVQEGGLRKDKRRSVSSSERIDGSEEKEKRAKREE
jgi:hypothetical protein